MQSQWKVKPYFTENRQEENPIFISLKMERKFLLGGGLRGQTVSSQVGETAAGISVKWLRKMVGVGFGN